MSPGGDQGGEHHPQRAVGAVALLRRALHEGERGGLAEGLREQGGHPFAEHQAVGEVEVAAHPFRVHVEPGRQRGRARDVNANVLTIKLAMAIARAGAPRGPSPTPNSTPTRRSSSPASESLRSRFRTI